MTATKQVGDSVRSIQERARENVLAVEVPVITAVNGPCNIHSEVALLGAARPHLIQAYRNAELAALNAGALSDPRVRGESYRAIGVGSFIVIPLVREQRWQFQASISHDQPRVWRAAEVEPEVRGQVVVGHGSMIRHLDR